MRISAILTAVLLTAGVTSAAHADSAPRLHDGFHFQVQTGLGYYSVSSDVGDISGMTIPTALLLGGTLMDGLAFGGGLLLDYAPSPTVSSGGVEVDLPGAQMVIGLGLYGDYYLDPAMNGLHFQGFLGWGGLEETEGAGGSDPTGLVTAAGVGYEVWISDQWSAGGMARLTYAPLSLNDVSFTTIAPAAVGTLTWH